MPQSVYKKMHFIPFYFNFFFHFVFSNLFVFISFAAPTGL